MSFPRYVVLSCLLALTGALLADCGGSGATPTTIPLNSPATIAQLQSKIQHVVVIYEENWSFDGLYGAYPGANGANGMGSLTQLQCPSGTTTYAPLTANPPALSVAGNPTGPWPCGWQGLAGVAQDPRIPTGLPLQPYDVSAFDPSNSKTGDLWHVF